MRLVDGTLERLRGFRPLGILIAALERCRERRVLTMASSLSFQTMVSVVPVLLFLIGILEHFIPLEPEKQLETFLSVYLLPEMAENVTDEILRIILGVNFAALGWIGAVGIFLATFMLVHNLKNNLDELGFRSSQSGFLRRMGWVTLVVLFIPPLSWLVVSEGRLFFSLPSILTLLRPFVSTLAVLFLAYRFLPDRGPTTAAALLSAALVALLLELEKIGLAFYVKRFEGVYEVVWGTLTFVPLVLAWLYVSWCVLLFGAALAWAFDDVLGRRQPTRIPQPPQPDDAGTDGGGDGISPPR